MFMEGFVRVSDDPVLQRFPELLHGRQRAWPLRFRRTGRFRERGIGRTGAVLKGTHHNSFLLSSVFMRWFNNAFADWFSVKEAFW